MVIILAIATDTISVIIAAVITGKDGWLMTNK